MPQVEVDEAELAALKNVSTLFNRTLNSKGREQLMRALKVANPDLPIPEIDAKDPILDELKAMRTSQEELAKKFQDAETKRDEDAKLSKLQAQWSEGRAKMAKYGYVGDALTALEKFMEEKGIADHELAAAAFEHVHPPGKPVESTSNKFDFFPSATNADDVITKGISELKEGKISDDQFLNTSVNQVLREMRGQAA